MVKLRQTFIISAIVLAAPLLSAGASAQSAGGPMQLAMMDMMPMGGGSMSQPGSGGMQMQNDNMRSMGSGQGGMQTMPGMAPPPAAGSGGMMNDNMMRMMQNMQRMAPGQAGSQQMPGAQSGMSMSGMQGGMPGMQGGMPPVAGATPHGSPSGMARMDDDAMGMRGQGSMTAMGSPAARLEGRIAFLRAELAITSAQAPAWEEFANTLRAGRGHLDAARAALQESGSATDPMARLEAYENHLRQRLDAIHMTRMAFNALFAQLDDTQKRKATSIMLPFIGRF